MPGMRLLWALIVSALWLAVQVPCNALFAKESSGGQYEVLSPWAEVDPIPLRGISPRLEKLAGKKIGLFVNYKRAARPIGVALEKRLKSMYPTSEISSFFSLEWNVLESESKNKEKFKAWAQGVDAVILLVGD